jgi:hypothetical protein
LKKYAWCLVLFTILLAGCVKRIVTLETNPAQAEVYLNYKKVGTTPCQVEFSDYGTHYIEIVKTGYENIRQPLKLKAPLYEFFPLNFICEVIVPWELKDEHHFSFDLKAGESKLPNIAFEGEQPGLPATELFYHHMGTQ